MEQGGETSPSPSATKSVPKHQNTPAIMNCIAAFLGSLETEHGFGFAPELEHKADLKDLHSLKIRRILRNLTNVYSN